MLLGEGHIGRKLQLFINIIVLGFSLHSSINYNYSTSNISWFDSVIFNVISSIQYSIASIKKEISEVIGHHILNVRASKENVALKETVQELKNQIFQYDEIARENIRLKELLQFSDRVTSKKVLARVVAWDSSSEFQMLRIDKGAKDGITLQSVAISSLGLVGYVYRLTQKYADILTILDRNNRVDGIIERIRVHGIVSGYKKGKCTMKYVSRSAPVILKDEVFTSGMGNIYPKGIKIGAVSRIEKESYGITQEIEVTPSIDLSVLEEVVVLVYDDQKERKKEWKDLDESSNKEEKRK